MKVHEYQAKELFAAYGIPVKSHRLCQTAHEAVEAYRSMGAEEVVLKAQVLTGGRGKAGGIKLANTAEEVENKARQILGMTIKDYPVQKILLCEAEDISAEFYVSFVVDRNQKSVVLIMSTEGGVEIESVAWEAPEKIHRHSIDPLIGLPDFLARRYAFCLFSQIDEANQLAVILQKLYKLFVEKDASLVEVNPLVLTPTGKLVAIDAKMTFDDNAMFRQPEIESLAELSEEEQVEASAKAKGFSYVSLNGEIGCMVNGAGLAMATMDMIKLQGGTPANFLDIGGSSNPRKVIEAMKLLLSDSRVKVVLINIFGGITRCDDVATGLLAAFNEIESDIPVIVRLTGTNENERRELLKGSRFLVAQTMCEATRKAVDIASKSY